MTNAAVLQSLQGMLTRSRVFERGVSASRAHWVRTLSFKVML